MTYHMWARAVAVTCAIVALSLSVLADSTQGGAAVRAKPSSGPVPAVTGPVTGGKGKPALLTTFFDLADFGYESAEYFIAGDAAAFTSTQPLTTDGKWNVTPTSTAPYVTRIVVYRPIDPADFSGTVFVEWLNVSSGFDIPSGWMLSHLQMLRSGAVWVGVSAQAVGVQGGVTIVGQQAAGGIKKDDPERYASLSHPGDSYSYDMFTQVGRAVAGAGAVKPLGDLKPKRIIATGQSQSAFRLVTYVNALQSSANVYDGFLVHSRFGSGAALSQAPLTTITVPNGTVIRTDVNVPVMIFFTETDLAPAGGAAARQPDTKRVHTWEVAGTAHADSYTGLIAFSDVGDGQAEKALLDVTNLSRGPLNCATPVNAGPQYAVLMAAISQLDQWVRTGTPPPTAPRLSVTDGPVATVSGQSSPTYVLTRDEHGNALGGVRTPFVDAPRAAITGELNSGGTFCRLFGTTTAFDAATISALYPSRDAWLAQFNRATKKAVKAGFLLPEEAKKLTTAAAEVPY